MKIEGLRGEPGPRKTSWFNLQSPFFPQPAMYRKQTCVGQGGRNLWPGALGMGSGMTPVWLG